MPESWTAADNPKLTAKLITVQLKDGRSLRGQVTFENGSMVIKTEKGEKIRVSLDEISTAPRK